MRFGPRVCRAFGALVTLTMLNSPAQGQTEDENELAKLSRDLTRLQAFQTALGEMEEDMARMQAVFTPNEKEHFSSQEHDQIEQILFRFLGCRESLWEMIDYYRDYREHFSTEETRARGFLIGFGAALNLYYGSASLVHTFLQETRVRAKLNESYYRSEIPAGIYDTLFKGVTLPENLQQMAAAWELFYQEIETPGTILNTLRKEDSPYRKLTSDIVKAHAANEKLREAILDETSFVLPGVRNALRHQAVTRLAQSMLKDAGDTLYAIRGLTFTHVSRLKNPMIDPLHVSSGQISTMKEMMRPGDIVLTFSAGYMSNVFLPGAFKHGITYVGLPEERQSAGLTTPEDFPSAEQRLRYEVALKQDRTGEGMPADCIEAVAEGVVFNSLENLLGKKTSRMVVFRPLLSSGQRVSQLTTVFRFLGCPYDFRFDFGDASNICCTEMIYRSLNGLGPVRFNLVPRMGNQTLSAEDICRFAVDEKAGAFDLVFLVVKDQAAAGNEAVVLPGDQGMPALKSLLALK